MGTPSVESSEEASDSLREMRFATKSMDVIEVLVQWGLRSICGETGVWVMREIF